MDNTKRFSDKAEGYAKYRPTYPEAFFDYLVSQVGFSSSSIVADIGAGTGIFSRQLSDKVRMIYAVEPNDNMRAELIRHCGENDNVWPIEGSAEDTLLPDQSVDFITAAQSFHWFDVEKTKKEFSRIGKPHFQVVLVWNTGDDSQTVIREYDAINRKFCPDYREGKSSEHFDKYRAFFQEEKYERVVFENDRSLTLDSFIGVSLSVSYALRESDLEYKAYIESLTNLFNQHADHGKLLLPTHTYAYVGKV